MLVGKLTSVVDELSLMASVQICFIVGIVMSYNIFRELYPLKLGDIES